MTNLEDVEGLELDVPTGVSEHHHHELEVLWIANVPSHGGEVVAIQEQLA